MTSNSDVAKKRTKFLFTKDEDERLKAIVGEYASTSEVNWESVAEKMQTRNARQCKERWNIYLSNMYNRSPFTLYEKCRILQLVEAIGNKWVIIAKYLDNRCDVDVKCEYKKMARNYITLDNILIIENMEASKRMVAAKKKRLMEQSAAHNDDVDIFKDFFDAELKIFQPR